MDGVGSGMTGVGASAGGLLGVRSNADLDKEAQAAIKRAEVVANKPQIKGLAAHIRGCFEAAERHRARETTDRLQECKRRRDGEYSPEKKAVIAAQTGIGDPVYFNVTDTKCTAAQSWIQDVFTKAVDDPWSLEPTPIPDLPGDLYNEIVQRTVATARMAMAQGEPMAEGDVSAMAGAMYDEALSQLRDESTERAARMGLKIEDQLVEGSFTMAFDAFLRDLCTFPVGIIKGPVIQKRKRLAWNGERVEVKDELTPMFYTVAPFDFWPAPNARSVNDAFVCETVIFSKAELARFRGAPGYSTEALEAVIASPGPGQSMLATVGEGDRANLENRDTAIKEGLARDSVRGIEFWGSVSGRMLRDWGMKPERVSDPSKYYEITAILVGQHVIKAILNPDPLGRRPYWVTSYEHVSGELWGVSIPEKMRNVQDAANAAMRNMISNLALSSGPQIAVDLDALDGSVDPTKVYPGKVWTYHGMKVPGGRVPVTWFQPNSNSAELMQVSEFFEQKADDRTQIPRYAHGNDNVHGAGSTASGLNMLMNAAAKGIKRIIQNIDHDVMRPLVEQIYRWNLVHLPDDEYASLKGDCRVVPRGVIAALVREQTQQRRLEFLNLTNNETDMAIIGRTGRASVLRKVAEELDMDTDKIVPEDEELAARLQQEAEATPQGEVNGPQAAAPA